MSIIIKGMDMPKSCDICPFSKTNDDLMSDDYRFRYCNFPCDFPYMGEFVTEYKKSRHPACPLCPVPPHGRLIDVDALFEEGADVCVGTYNALEEQGFSYAKIASMPTIIEAEGKDDG